MDQKKEQQQLNQSFIFHVSIIKNRKYKVVDIKVISHDIKPYLKYVVQNVKENSMKTFKYEDIFAINVISSQNYLFISISSESVKVETNFKFLNDLKDYFNHQYPNHEQKKITRLQQKQLEQHIINMITDYNQFHQRESMGKAQILKQELKETQDIFQEDFAKILEREGKLDELNKKTQKMVSNPIISLKDQLIKQKEIKYKGIQQNMKIKKSRLLIICIIAAIFLLIAYLCGGLSFNQC